MKKKQEVLFGFAVLLIAAIFALVGCGGGGSGGDLDLNGAVTIIPNDDVTTGDLLTAYYYGGGTETIETYQWKRGNANVGTNSNIYTPDEAGIYSVTIGAKGYKSKTSTAVEVIVSAGELDLTGTIVISPVTNVKVNTALTATYSGGSETVTYQWQRDGANVGTNSNIYTPNQAGLYSVTVSAEGYKSKTSAAVNVTTSTGNTAPKSLYVIGITETYMDQSTAGGFTLVFPAGTTRDDAKADLRELYLESGSIQHAIAGVNFQTPVKVGSTYAATGDLYASDVARWTGSGTVDMYALCSDGTKGYLYKVPNLLIQSAVTTVSLFDLEVVFLGEMELPSVPGISGTITLADMPTNPAPERIWINVEGSKVAGTWWYNDSHGGNGVNFNKGYANLPWKIKISDFVWSDPENTGRKDFFPADLYFRVSVHFDGDDDSRNYDVRGIPVKHINSEEDAVNIDLGTVSLVKQP